MERSKWKAKSARGLPSGFSCLSLKASGRTNTRVLVERGCALTRKVYFDNAMIVMKFGGSSLESAAAVEKVADIIGLQEHAEIVVVVSAMGKTTDRLLEIAETAVEGRTAETLRLSRRASRLPGRRGEANWLPRTRWASWRIFSAATSGSWPSSLTDLPAWES